MSGDSKDNGNDTQESVQDYLDLLLVQATEKPETQVEEAGYQELESRQSQPQQATKVPATKAPATKLQSQPNNVTPLSMVASRALGASAPARPRVSSPAFQPPAAELKPYAEPAKPVRLKSSIPLLKAERKVEIKEPVKPVAEAAPVVKKPVEAPPAEIPPVKAPEPVTPEPIAPIAPPVVEQAPVPVEPDTERLNNDDVELTPSEVTTTQWLENGRPSWAQQRFECLLFSVGGLTLAVPLVELGTIFPMTDELTPLFGQIDWFMGLLPVKDGNLRTVDTARVVMPERYDDSMKEQYKYVISLNEMDWGLAVDSVATAIVLEPEDVRWRSERSKRPWLAGTVVEQMCALLDISQLAAMFVAQDGRK